MTLYTAIGLMSGTSCDGIDVARITTDGQNIVRRMDSAFYPYDDATRKVIKDSFGIADRTDPRVVKAEKVVTDAHIEALLKFGHKANIVGFHGQTTFHDPANGVTIQLGDGKALAEACGMDVVYDLRSADVAAGGQGAPLLPLYHRVLVKSAKVALPCAIVNIGGVSNITYIGKNENEVIAFDTGPGNALLDDWVLQHTGQPYDKDGKLSAAGTPNTDIIIQVLNHAYFKKAAPKSLDRNAFPVGVVNGLSVEDGAATLATLTVETIVKSFAHLPAKPQSLYITGGGRKNNYIMRSLSKRAGAVVVPVEEMDWDGDSIEAEGFAYLAVRSRLKLPISLPKTTGVPKPLTGGVLARFAPVPEPDEKDPQWEALIKPQKPV